MRNRRRPRRLIATLASAAVLVGLAACSTETVTPGIRPNRPADAALPVQSPETDPAKLALDPTSLPGYRPATAEGDGVYSRPLTDAEGSVRWKVLDGNNQTIDPYEPDRLIAFGDPVTYTDPAVKGVLTFRGNNHRTGGAYGTADVLAKRLQIVWTKEIGEVRGEGSYWPGAGWTGQPLLVNWPQQTKAAMGLDQKLVDDPNFVEVIYPVFEGKVYRLNLADGTPTKDPIDVKFGFKGTGSVDPRGYPLLYAGQGLNDRNGTVGYWRYRMFDLIQNKEIFFLSGLDEGAPRAEWGAFDSSALINRQTDTLIEPAENGLIYKVTLNTRFDPAAKTVTLDPEVTKLAYAGPDSVKHGIENSAVAYRNLMFAADNDGMLFCWDVNTLQVLWMRNVGDDTDATLALDATDEGVFLYTGNQVDHRGANGGERITNIRKIDALTGAQVWQYDVPTYYDPAVNGGVLGSPIVGQGSIGDMVIFNVARTTAPREGDLVALDKKTGGVIWRRHLANYSWSSPTLITGSDGTQYGVLPDSAGTIHLFDPNTGLDLSTLDLGKNTEATISAYNDMLVVASYDRKIYGIRIT
nr:PQQ-binding-like beta-propeller repeat protein [Propionibacterium sp.]